MLTRSRRLGLEQLEDRCVPAPLNSMLWIGQDGGSLTDNNSWIVISGGWGTGAQIAPTQYDEMVFDPSESVAGVQGTNTSPGGSLSGNQDAIFMSPVYTGTVWIAAGNTATITESLDMQGGKLGGGGDLVLNTNGSTSTLGSGMASADPFLEPDQVTVSSGSVLDVQGESLMGTTLKNYGTVAYQGQGYTASGPLGNGAYNYGLIDIQGDMRIGTATWAINNYGTLQKSGGTGTTVIDSQVVNYGTFGMMSGTVELTSWSKQSVSAFYPNQVVQTMLNGGSLTLDNGYTMLGGWLDGVGTVNGNVNAGDPTGKFAGNGWVHPGFLPTNSDATNGTAGRINITGDLWVAQGAGIYIELTNGWDSGVAQVAVNGLLTLNGNIVGYRHADFIPTSGSTNVVTYGSEAGNGGISVTNNDYSVDGVLYAIVGQDKLDGQNAWTLWVAQPG